MVLGWIRGHPAGWKTYVTNRVSEIQISLPDAMWHHVPRSQVEKTLLIALRDD